MFHWQSKKKKTVHRKKTTKYHDKFTFNVKESFHNNNDVVMVLYNAFDIPEEILFTDDHLTSRNSKVDRIVKNVAKAVKCQDLFYKGLHTDELHEKKKKAIEEIHSVLFYCVLKNNGFECEEADEYYEVLEGLLPELDWDIYLSIVITCHWSELFAKCLNQLPDGIVATILKLVIIEAKKRNYNNIFILCHGIIQAIMLKLFPIHGTLAPASHMMFQFQFCCSYNIQVSGNSDFKTEISLISNEPDNYNSFIEILSLVLDFISSEKDQKFTTVLLNGLITAFDSFIKCETPNKVNQNFINLEGYSTFIEQYFQSEDVLGFLKTELEAFQFFNFIQTFTMEERYCWLYGYLLLLVNEKWQEVKEIVDHESKTFKSLDNLVDNLFSSHPIKFTDKPVPDEYIRLLISLLKNDLDGRKSAFDILSGDMIFLQRTDVQGCIANDIHQITDSKRYHKLMTAAFSTSGSGKEPLYNLFLSWYRSVDYDLKEEILQSCLSEFGLSAFNKAVDFDSRVNMFLNKAGDLDTAVFFLYEFCIESPQDTLQKILTHVIENGAPTLVLIQALKSVSFVCSYQRTSVCLPLLIEVLKPHLIDKILSSVEKKNVCLIIEELMKVFPSDNSFSRYHFIMHCVLPNFSSESNLETMEFACDLLNRILSRSINTDFVSWLTEIRPLPLMLLACSMLNYCFFYHNIQFKDDIINIVNIFHQLNSKFQIFEKLRTEECQKQLHDHLRKLNPIVKFYVVDYIVEPNFDVSSLSLDLLLFWCIIKEDIESFSESPPMKKLSVVEYSSLVKAVAKDIIDLTCDEFLKLSRILMKFKLQPLEATEDSSEEKKEPCQKTEEPNEKTEEPCKKVEEPYEKIEESCKKTGEEYCEKTEKSCEETEASCEKTEASCEKTEASCEKTEASCEKTEASCERTEASCEKTEEFCKKIDESMKPCEKIEESCIKIGESCEETEASCEKTEESNKKTEESDKKTEESDKKTEESDKKTEESCKEINESCKKLDESSKKHDKSCKNIDECCKKVEEQHRKTEEPSEKNEIVAMENLNPIENQHNVFNAIKVCVDALILLYTYAPMAKLEHAISNFHNVIENYSEDICCSLPTFKKVFLEICGIATKLISYSNLIGRVLTDLLAKFEKVNGELPEALRNEIQPVVDDLFAR